MTKLSVGSWSAQPEVRISAFYLTFFMAMGVAIPYMSLWLQDLGLSFEQIGFVNATPVALMIGLGLLVGKLADRAPDWRVVIIAGSLLAGITSVGLIWASGFWSVLLIWTLVMLPVFAIAPVVDAAAIRLLKRSGGDFGKVRAWGTVGFVIVTIIGGASIQQWGIGAMVPLVIGASLLRAAVSLQLPLFRAPPSVRQPTEDTTTEALPSNPLMARRLRDMMQLRFALPLLGAAFLQASHMLLMGFGALIWRDAGISPWLIGALWIVAPMGEIVIMIYFQRIARRYSARHLILAACVLGAVRWVGFAMDPTIVWLALFQVLHMASFGLAYMGVVSFIANWTDEGIAAQAQSLFVMVRQFFEVLALAGFGWLVAVWGAQSYFVASGLAATGGALTLASLFLMRPRRDSGD